MNIKISDLSHSYDGTNVVLNDVCCELSANETMVITGPSGCGKSTLMNCLSLLLKPTQGKIEIDGTDVTGFSEKQAATFRLNRIGMVRQDLALLPHRTALENVIVPLLLQNKMKKKEMLDAGRERLAEVGLAEHADKPIGKLSGGQRQRVAIARAIVTNPVLILADEPTAQLDEANAKHVTELLIALSKQNRMLFFATHDVGLLEYFDKQLHLR